jgi:hypothetical protein
MEAAFVRLAHVWPCRPLAAIESGAVYAGDECGRGGLRKLNLKSTLLVGLFLIVSSCPAVAAVAADDQDENPDSNTAAIVQKYLQAQQDNEDALRGASMKVDIQAAVPGLKEHGRLSALRKISKVGQVTYKQLGFQGDGTIKRDVISRYLQAEQQGQGDPSLAITPANYKFKFKGLKILNDGRRVYVLQVAPRKKKVGLFKGQVWLDTKTYLPLVEKGRLVKNPSIFFKKVDFERDYAVKDGIPIPQHLSSTIDVHLIGTVELSIDYSDYDQHGGEDTGEPRSAAALTGAGVE